MSVATVSKIESSDSIQSELFNIVITIGTTDTFTTQLSALNSQVFNESKITLEIVCASLDSTVTLSQYRGNQYDFTKMSPIVDTKTGANVADVLDNGNYIIDTITSGFFLGLELNPDSATTGTVTIIGRA